MRRLILKMSLSLDGFVGGPKGELDWVFRSEDEKLTEWEVALFSRAGAHLMGSRTYQDMAAYWPASTSAYAPAMNGIPKVIFSKQGSSLKPDAKLITGGLQDAPESGDVKASAEVVESWRNPLVLSGDLSEEIAKLKRQEGKDLVAHGGASFARSLIAANLIDEYRLIFHPVVVGKGLPIFSGLTKPRDLQLLEGVDFPAGAVGRVYRPDPH